MLKKGTFVSRINRFAALVNVDREMVQAHVPNSGRLTELLREGAPIVLRQLFSPSRKTSYDLLLVEYPDAGWVLIEATAANQLMHDYIKGGHIDKLLPYDNIKREATFGNSRFDIMAWSGEKRYYMEVKCVTLVDGGVAMFPDAPTERGRKHIEELIKAKKQGYGVGIAFVIQRCDAKSFMPNFDMDPEFSETLKTAYNSGVDLYAFNCTVTEKDINIKDAVPVMI